MKKITLLLFALFTVAASAEKLLIEAKGYIDVRAGALVTPGNILVEDGYIKAINPASTANDVVRIVLTDQILMPGLMDMHVHLDIDFVPDFDKLTVTENASKGALRAAKNAELTLMAGFTTIRNIGQANPTRELIGVALSEASDEGWVKAPRIIDSGHIIGITGGHGDISMVMGLAEGVLELGPDHGMINGVDDAIQATRYQIKHGAKAIKVSATAGVLSMEASVGAQQVSNEEMAAIVAEANRHHVTVAAHAHGAEGIKEAIKMGVHSIEHGSLLDAEGMRMMKKNDVYLVPTTGLLDLVLKNADRLDPVMEKKARYVLPLAKENFTKAIKAGVKVALGTDAPLIPHGQNAYELSAMIARGMSTKTALKSATINPAALLRLKDRGEIKAGLMADIIAVKENPLKNIKTLEQVSFVMKGGEIYKQ